jgi:hypothetical protein
MQDWECRIADSKSKNTILSNLPQKPLPKKYSKAVIPLYIA